MHRNIETLHLVRRDIDLIKDGETEPAECEKPPGIKWNPMAIFAYLIPPPLYTSDALACYYSLILDQLSRDMTSLEERLQLIETKLGQLDPMIVQKSFRDMHGFKQDVKEILSDIAQVASEASQHSFSWSINSIPGSPPEFRIRVVMVSFMVSASEIGNQLGARADALLKQMDGLDRRELPLSVQLRDTDATEFIRLYEWLKAHPVFGIGQPGSNNERMKAVRRLFADHHWSNINTVYASGWGKGSMALIKDDIGNWNLKSFDSDPEELLRAYKNFSITVLETAAKAASAVATGGSSAGMDKLLEVAAEYFTPTPGSVTSGAGAGQFRLLSERTSAQLHHVESQVSSSRAEDTQARDDYQKAVETLKGMKRDDPNYAKQEEAVGGARKALVAGRTRVLEDIEKILLEHSELVDLLAKGTKAN
jgi:hypothetical protein